MPPSASRPRASRPRRIRPAHQRAVLDWYAQHGRVLAFRGAADPWAILVSEVMAQQTQAARAAEAWPRFMAAFPTPESLASASPAAVLRAWRGLGYNRRALALRQAAIRIVGDHAGEVPADLAALRRLPGVGPYTARAVAALAFGAPVGPVDVNVRRVLTRAFFDDPPSGPELQAFADGAVATDAPGQWTHALMDLGARVCRPARPRCEACPLAPACRYIRRPDGTRRVTPAASRPRAAPATRFQRTARWLRGRMLDRLRDAADGTWVSFDAPIGQHDITAIEFELERLAREGLLERHPRRRDAARLPA